MQAIAKTRCSESPEVVPLHGKIDQARAAWGKKLGMVDADWADAVEFIDNRDGNYPKIELSTKVIAQFTPMDQFRAIHGGLTAGNVEATDVYLADAMNAQLTEVGRLAFLEFCFQEHVEHAQIDRFAVCQGDIDAWDLAKFSAQLRSDKAHDGGTKMLLRFRALAMADTIKSYNEEKAKLIKTDETYQKVFDTAAKARAEWAKGIGSNTKLLELVQAMDSASLSGSRKLFADCDKTTTAALHAAISTIPAKAFKGMADVRDDPFAGFAYAAGPVLVNTPVVNLAANAWMQCHRGTPTADWLAASLQTVPGVRGPRSAVIGALLDEKFEFDDVNARPLGHLNVSDGRPYRRTGGTPASGGGVVNKVTAGTDHATVSLQKTKVKRFQCIKSHRTHRLSRINSDGSISYEEICDKSGVVEYDTTWADFKINPAQASMLKKGVVFSAYIDNKYDDVIAIWPSKSATVPSMVLGAKVK